MWSVTILAQFTHCNIFSHGAEDESMSQSDGELGELADLRDDSDAADGQPLAKVQGGQAVHGRR